MSEKRSLPPLAEKRFWDIIAASIRPNPREQYQALVAEVSRLDDDDILAFHLRVWDYLGKTGQRELWQAAALMLGWCSADGFLYFRCWLIARGWTVFNKVTQNPDSLADLDRDDDGLCEFEYLLSVAESAREEVEFQRMFESGEDNPADDDFQAVYDRIDQPRYPEVQGEAIDLEDDSAVRRRYPRLAAKYLDGENG